MNFFYIIEVKNKFERINNKFRALNQDQSQVVTEFCLDMFGVILCCRFATKADTHTHTHTHTHFSFQLLHNV